VVEYLLQMSNNKFKKFNLNEIPLEDAHGGSGKRQLLVSGEHVSSDNLEAITKGFLNSGSSYDWHTHEGIDEIFIVLKGGGKFYCEDEEAEYKEGDIFITAPNVNHKITAEEVSEFYFIRVK